MTKQQWLRAMAKFCDGERMVPEAYVGGLNNVKVHFMFWEMVRDQLREGDKVLEIGCGCGLPARIYHLKTRRLVVAVDKHEVVAMSRILYPTPGVLFVGVDLDELFALAGGPYDVLVAIEMLDHLRDPAGTLDQVRPYLKPEARVYASVPYGHQAEDANAFHGHWWATKEEFRADVARWVGLPEEQVTAIHL